MRSICLLMTNDDFVRKVTIPQDRVMGRPTGVAKQGEAWTPSIQTALLTRSRPADLSLSVE